MAAMGDTRIKAAVYSYYINKREKRACELVYCWCAISGFAPTFYLDKTRPKRGEQPPVWQRLLIDLDAGKWPVLVLWFEVPGMEAWCEDRGVKIMRIDPFEFSRAMRESTLLR